MVCSILSNTNDVIFLYDMPHTQNKHTKTREKTNDPVSTIPFTLLCVVQELLANKDAW